MKKVLKFFFIFILVVSWIYSGWPPIWDNPSIPPKIELAHALVAIQNDGGPTASTDTQAPTFTLNVASGATMVVVTISVESATISSVADSDGDTYVAAIDSTATAPKSAIYYSVDATVNASKVITVTFSSSAADSVIGGFSLTGTETSSPIDSTGESTGTNSSISQTYSTNNNDSLIVWAVANTWDQTFSSPGSGQVQRYQATQGGGTKYSSFVSSEITTSSGSNDQTVTVGSNNKAWTVVAAEIKIAPNSAPNAPSQDSPANSATGVSVTPNFLMTATDPDSDDLSYKVTIYSASGCSASLVSTHDQSITSTGWTGTDASCTASPTSCYLSGTQGDFTLQSGDALSNSTQYWWRASAKDPDGTGTFTDSATCNTFTTGAASSLTAIISTDVFPTVAPGGIAVFATSTIDVDTNSASGWSVALYGDDQSDADTVMDLVADDSVSITDQTEWVPGAATTTAGNAVRIASFDSSGDVLSIRVMTASGTQAFIADDWWGTADDYADNVNTLWAGIASTTASDKTIGNSSVDSGGGSALNTVLYYLKVPSIQQSGDYSGNLTFTTVVNP